MCMPDMGLVYRRLTFDARMKKLKRTNKVQRWRALKDLKYLKVFAKYSKGNLFLG